MRLVVCQTPEILGNVERALAHLSSVAARHADADLLLFPECFLQGYLVTEPFVHRQAMELGSTAFGTVLRRLAPLRPTLVFGVIERDTAGRFFNTAAVVAGGVLLGAYRKTHLGPGESIFQPGSVNPVFEVAGVRFGINICYDTQFPEAAAAVAAHGARLLLVPAQNMMRLPAAEWWRHRHNRIRAERVRETGLWLASADVTGTRDAHRVGYGPTSIMNPRAEIVAQVPLRTVGCATATID